MTAGASHYFNHFLLEAERGMRHNAAVCRHCKCEKTHHTFNKNLDSIIVAGLCSNCDNCPGLRNRHAVSVYPSMNSFRSTTMSVCHIREIIGKRNTTEELFLSTATM
jgi:hypothetical protein